MAAQGAVSHPALFHAPLVPGPFAAAGRAVRCRDGTFDSGRPGHLALRADGRHAGRHRLGPHSRPPHPPPMPRPARRRAENRRRLRRRHQRTTTATTQPRPGVVVHDHDQPQPRSPVPAHDVTVRPDRTHTQRAAREGAVASQTALGHQGPSTVQAKMTGLLSAAMWPFTSWRTPLISSSPPLTSRQIPCTGSRLKPRTEIVPEVFPSPTGTSYAIRMVCPSTSTGWPFDPAHHDPSP